MARVELSHVDKIYPGNVQAVTDVDFTVEDKEFIVLVGPSGCGKSTTLRMVAGLEEITNGEIRIGDRVVNDVAPKNRDIAMVFQNYALYPHMTVYKNMAFGLMLRKFPKSEIEERVRDAARILSIEHLLDRKPKALSGGERQRVAVGRAIVRDPAVFLFDEPLSNLDAKLRVQMRAEINKLHQRLETTMMYVTHDQTEAMTMGDRIVVMLDGRIQQIGTPMEIYGEPVNKFVAGFIGSPPMNFFDGEIRTQNGDMRFVAADGAIDLSVHESHRTALESYAGKKVAFGIRPEDMTDNEAQQPVDGMSFTSTVEVVEPMGSETYLYLDVNGIQATARVNPDVARKAEENASHILDATMEKAHYFDPSSEEAIR